MDDLLYGHWIDEDRFTFGINLGAWVEANLCHGPGDVRGEPWTLNDDQLLLLRDAYVYVRDPSTGLWRRRVRRAFYSRPKGAAKSEIAGGIVCVEALAPCRFDGFNADGIPVARPVREPFIRCLATEEGQAGNTYDNVRVMLTEGPITDNLGGLDVGLTRTFLPNGGEIRPSTSGAASKDGGKESFAVCDESHLYVLPEHRAMFDTVRRNLAKRKAAEPWLLETSTMYRVGQESVAEQTHNTARAIADGKIRDPGLLFSHKAGPEEFDWNDDEQLRAALAEAYEGVSWVDLDRLVDEIRDPATSEEDARRYFLNQAVSSTSSWITEERWDELAKPDERLRKGEPITLGFDGSHGRADGRPADSTALIGCRVSDGHLFVLGIWEQPPGETEWEPPRQEVDAAVKEAFTRFRVLRFYGDPAFWQTELDQWASAAPRRTKVAEFWTHRPRPTAAAVQRLHTAIQAGEVSHDGDPTFRRHMTNATKRIRTMAGEDLVLIGKATARSPRKMDAAMAAVLAYEARGDALAAGEAKRRGSGGGRAMGF